MLEAFKQTREIIGDVIAVGIREAQTTAALANACFPMPLHVVEATDADADRMRAAESLTKKNLEFHPEKLGDYLTRQTAPIKFCCFDASQLQVKLILPHLLPGGVICGLGAAPSPDELSGVRIDGQFWSWQSTGSADPSQPLRHTKNPLNLGKRNPYYRAERNEVITAIIASGIKPQKVVELGCSSGTFGAKVKERLQVPTYIGIELEPDAAKLAQEKLDQVHIANISTTGPAELGIGTDVDLIVALDVLEHLYNPWDTLTSWVSALRPGGHVLTSIPNVQNITLLQKLVQGRWDYEPEGLLDVTHVRFFTERSVHQLLNGAGLQVIHTTVVTVPTLDTSKLTETGNSIKIQNLSLSNLTRRQVVQLHAYQYLVIARKPE